MCCVEELRCVCDGDSGDSGGSGKRGGSGERGDSGEQLWQL